ncbi:hypothetical protein F3Y22_tig00113096pilonHSYRG00058 [Hibiscus syriacus]|uniref:Multiple C2 domain-containing protein n=1 Tax=Hibiscus syriacus TaxID=106335 RepID=A0A6A2XMA1_HIBSY|nr:hypothetical protein F3Y22_tig00113096pilonHSYRG00058 [Hibiscus syriacus]
MSTVTTDEFDEEFDTMPIIRSPGVIRTRYNKLHAIEARVQNILGATKDGSNGIWILLFPASSVPRPDAVPGA